MHSNPLPLKPTGQMRDKILSMCALSDWNSFTDNLDKKRLYLTSYTQNKPRPFYTLTTPY